MPGLFMRFSGRLSSEDGRLRALLASPSALNSPRTILARIPLPLHQTPQGLAKVKPSSLCTGLVDLVQELENELHTHILTSSPSLKGTSVAPLTLLSVLRTLQPLHMHLPMTRKHRPPEALLQASQSYVSLRGQLALELPVYVKLLERGIDGVCWT
ncbi:hypothetical protein CY34DRAFT_245087 [Suillus luteus UH-Slu-Lm8-n1]|uniref:Uncharacterized protein n=1 Tax=Suillus luteus UH-Slu-Lm8-n1 TaxID=930992 RepID=A0A0D0ARX7_9AGAM|nr:hypothetical protein CY34DRAFT_245087 [Suillus luteus UH-Slu-Lm8-n1]